MEVEIRPEPAPEEREAILLALSRPAGGNMRPSAWWATGLREAVEGGPEDHELG